MSIEAVKIKHEEQLMRLPNVRLWASGRRQGRRS